MHGLTLLQDLAVIMIVAGFVTVVFHKLKQPVVLGYILAGVIIGPHTPPYQLIQGEHTIQTLSELGIILLLFSLGLEFNLRKLTQVGLTALMGAVCEIVLMMALGYGIGLAFGWSAMDSLFLGAMLSISSTTIIIKALNDLGLAKERFAGMIFGILIIEDILAIVMLVLLSGIAMTGSLSLGEVGLTMGKLGIFLVTALIFGYIAVPRLLNHIGRFKSNEMTLVAVLGLCFGFSLLAAKLGYSVALGAFVIGAVISEARDIVKIEHLVEPVRDMFSAVFFVTIGLMIEPKLLIEYALPIAVISLVTIVGKIVSCGFGTFVAGNDSRTSLKVGMGLAQIGEFSFIIASLGLSLNVTSKFLYPIAVAVSAITTLTTPYLIRGSDGFIAVLYRRAPRALLDSMDLYTQWVGQQLSGQRQGSFAGKLLRRWSIQIALNMALIAAVFIAAAFVGRWTPSWLPEVLKAPGIYRSVVWLTAVILTLPMSIAVFRKFQALAILVAELRVTRARAGARTDAIRHFVSQAITLLGLAGLIFYVLALSSTLLPSINTLLALLVVIALLTWLLWGAAIRIHSRAQIAFEATLSQPAVVRTEPEAPKVARLLRDADLETITLPVDTPAAHRTLRELGLRTLTGASVVGIERDGNSIINPGPEEELRPGDQVLLLGHKEQLEKCVQVLTTGNHQP